MKRKEKRRLKKADRRKTRGLRAKARHVMSNFRLSLTFRIALHYAWQLLRTTWFVMLLVTAAYLVCTLLFVEDALHRAYYALPDSSGYFTQTDIQNSSMLQGRLLPEPYQRDKGLGFAYRITSVSWQQITFVGEHSTGMTAELIFSTEDCILIWLTLMGVLLGCDMMRICIFMSRRERLNKSVLSPIHDITEMATTLSASNLSNRINIAGTKNELKDLAVVINSMLDRIERSYNSQKQFVSDASHELRTPIAVVQGYVNMLKRWGKSDPEVLDEGINAIAQETESMKELVESLLFLARHDKKTLMMEMEPFDAMEVLLELHREAAMVTPEDTFILTSGDPCPMEGDRSMVKQVMRILCDNAVKYTPDGGIVTLSIRREPGWVTLSVADNGPGIPEEELAKIFARFYRADAARRSQTGGHGLGLSIARIIVMAHGGKMRVRSKVGVGSTFEVVLPDKQQSLHGLRDVSQASRNDTKA